MEIKISVIVPVYNVEKYLRDCLDSVLDQSFEDYEVICIDDGSTDGSSDILHSYKERDARVHVVRQENSGLSVARNVGIGIAIGQYICFLDSDDMLVEGALEKMWEAVESDSPDILTYKVAPLLYENISLKGKDNKDEYYRVSKDYSGIRTGRNFFVEQVENNDFIESAWLMFIKREWLSDNGIVFCPGALFEDSVFAIQCYFACEKMKNINEALYIYRVREGSIMTQKYTFRHAYYRIWQFSECLRTVYTTAHNEREINALSKYAEQSMTSLKHVVYRLEEKEARKLFDLNPYYMLLAKGLGLFDKTNEHNKRLAYEGLVSILEKSERVILYGAGVIGNKIRKVMENKNLHGRIQGFAVSDKKEVTYIENIPVRCITDYDVEEGTVVIISARTNYHKDMSETAKRHGFKNMVAIDYELECVIDERLEEMELQ